MATRNVAALKSQQMQKTAQMRIDNAIKSPQVKMASKMARKTKRKSQPVGTPVPIRDKGGNRNFQPMPEGGLPSKNGSGGKKGGKGARGQGAVRKAGEKLAQKEMQQNFKAKTSKRMAKKARADYMHPELRAAARRRIMAKGSSISVKQMSGRIHKRRARKHALGTAKSQQGKDTKS